MIDMSRSVRSRPSASPCWNAFAAIENEPITIFSDLTIPKMPAVAIAPTPMKRTYQRKICAALILEIGIGAG